MNHARLLRQNSRAKVVFPAPLGPAMIMQRGEWADLLMIEDDSNYSVLMKQGGTPCGRSRFNVQKFTERNRQERIALQVLVGISLAP